MATLPTYTNCEACEDIADQASDARDAALTLQHTAEIDAALVIMNQSIATAEAIYSAALDTAWARVRDSYGRR